MRACAIAAALLVIVLAGGAQAQLPPGVSTGPALRFKQIRQNIAVDSGGRREITTTVQIQVLTEAAAARASQTPLPFDATVEDIAVLEAYTLKSDGSKLVVDPANILTQKAQQANPLAPIYSDAEQKIILFPRVEVGDTLVYSWKTSEKKVAIDGQFGMARYLTTGAEADDSIYSITVPKAMHVNLAYREMTQSVSTQDERTTYSLSFSNLIPRGQPAHPVIDPDRGPHFLVSTFKSYDEFAHAFAGLMRPKIKVTPEIQKQADAITANVSGQREQARAIYDWVTRHIRYVALEFGTGGVIPHDADWTLNNGFGDCKDKAILFASLLKAKGIAADPVLINALNRYRLSGVPTASEFNHVIVWLSDLHLYADPTATGFAFQALPLMEYGKPVLHLVESGIAVHDIPTLPAEVATSSYRVHATMNSEGRFDVDVVTSATGPWAAGLHRLSDQIQTVGSTTAAAGLLKTHNFVNATGSFAAVSDSSAVSQFTLGGTFHAANPPEADNVMNLARGLQILNRAGDGPMGPLNNNGISDIEETPCYSGHQVEDIVIDFAKDGHVADVPANVHLKTANLSYDTQWSISDHSVSLHREFISKISEPTCKGQVRLETARALARIREDYAQAARFVPK